MRPTSMTLPTTVSEGTLGVSFNDEDKPPMPRDGMRAISAISSAAAASVGEFSRAQSAGLGPLVSGYNAPMPPPAQRINGANGAALAGAAALGIALASRSSGAAGAKTTASGSPPAPPSEAPQARSPRSPAKESKPAGERTKILAANPPSTTMTDSSLDERAREVSGKLLDPVDGPVYAPEKAKPALVKKVSIPATSKTSTNAEPFGPPPPPAVAPEAPPAAVVSAPACDPAITSGCAT